MERIQRERGADGPGKCPPKRACKLYVLLERPKRPLSAYNLFFQSERQKLLDQLPVRARGKPRNSHGKLGFKQMATIIGARWRAIDCVSKEYFIKLAIEHKERYLQRINEWHEQQNRLREPEAAALQAVSASASGAVFSDECQPFEQVLGSDTSIAALASRLDADMINDIIRIFL